MLIPLILVGLGAARSDALEGPGSHALGDEFTLSGRAIEVVFQAALTQCGTFGLVGAAGE